MAAVAEASIRAEVFEIVLQDLVLVCCQQQQFIVVRLDRPSTLFLQIARRPEFEPQCTAALRSKINPLCMSGEE